MDSITAITLVFTVAVLWMATVIVLLAMVDRMERRALRAARKAAKRKAKQEAHPA